MRKTSPADTMGEMPKLTTGVEALHGEDVSSGIACARGRAYGVCLKIK
jgi:hypothetical protein